MFQFTISVVLIICGIVISKQIDYIQNVDTGVNKSNIVMIPFAPSIGAHYKAFKQETSAIAGVQQTSTAHYPMYKGYDAFFYQKLIIPIPMFSLPVMNVDENFIAMLHLQWKNNTCRSNVYTKGSCCY